VKNERGRLLWRLAGGQLFEFSKKGARCSERRDDAVKVRHSITRWCMPLSRRWMAWLRSRTQ
jgi:hypothetical protein